MNHQTILLEKEKVIEQKLEKHSLIEESVIKHNSRIQWVKLGDSNNRFFFVSMKNRVAHIHIIRSLVNEQGALTHTEKPITEEILSYYKQLLGSTTKPTTLRECESYEIMSNFEYRKQQLNLIDPVTRKKILDALHGIDDHKAPW